MKKHFLKSKPSIITYRSYKKFDNKKFMENLNAEIITQSNYLEKDGIDAFFSICCEVSNKHAPQKQRYLRANHKPFINAEISKTIMIRSRMRNRFLKHRSDENRRLFQKQRNNCVSLLRKARKEYFSSSNINKVVDNKSFWKIVKPFLSNLTISSEKITLIDDDELITDEQKVANTLNDFFSSIVTSLNLPESQNAESLSDNTDHPTLKAIKKWRNHPSVLAIIAVHENRERFTFSCVTIEDFVKEINILNSSKAIQEADLPVKLLKDNKDFFAAYIAKYFNDSLKSEKFPNCLKLELHEIGIA